MDTHMTFLFTILHLKDIFARMSIFYNIMEKKLDVLNT